MNRNETIVLMGASEFHEKLIFSTPAPEEIINNIQSYCNEIVFRLNHQTEDEEICVNAFFDIDGVYTDIKDTDAFIEASRKLIDANSFEFDIFLDAHYVSGIYKPNPANDEDEDDIGSISTWLTGGLYPYLNSVKSIANFEYKKIEYCPNSGSVGYVKIVDGCNIDINACANENFPLTATDTYRWNSLLINMGYYRDDITDEHAEKIHEIAKKYIPDSEIAFCETDWEECNDVILSGVQWLPESLKEVSDFLNELNDVYVLPEKDRNKYKPEPDDANLWYDMHNFAIAFYAEIDGKFVLLGTDF